MPTTELTATELRANITALQRALGQEAIELRFSDGRTVRYKSDEEKRTAIGYFEGLLATVEATGRPRPRRLVLAPTSGVERHAPGRDPFLV